MKKLLQQQNKGSPNLLAGLMRQNTITNSKKRDTITGDKSQGGAQANASSDEEEREDIQQARVDIEELNETIMEDTQTYLPRNMAFDEGYLLKDSQQICYTYMPKNVQGNIEFYPPNQVDQESDQAKDSSDSDDGRQRKILHGVLQKMNDLYEQANESESKYDPNTYHWQILKQWREKNVKYRCIRDIQGYTFKAEDEQSYFSKMVEECNTFFNKLINDSRSESSKEGDVALNMLSNYKVNPLTGEKFLRIAIRQWKTSYDPEIIKNKAQSKVMSPHSTVKTNEKEYEVHSLKFFKFDEELQEFQQEDEILYDISDSFLDLKAGGFTNDYFMTKNQHTYYFKKDKERHGFQLWRHSYGTPFQKFPIDNDPFPIHSNVMMEDYFIQAPENKILKDLQIVFLHNSSKKYSLREHQLMEEKEFLQNQFILIKDKIYEIPNVDVKDRIAKTDVYIYNVSSGEQLYDSTQDDLLDIPYEDFQVGFFITEASDDPGEDEESTKFMIKCLKTDFLIYFVKGKQQCKYERSPTFLRYNQHMIMPQNLDIHLERLQEKFDQAFFFTKQNSSVNFIYPHHSSKEENISSDIKNKQEEVSKHIQQHFLDNESGKIVYQNSEFAFIFNENFSDKILSEINPKTGFKLNDEYISTSDMILKVNISENDVHVWSMRPQYEYTSFRETLTEMQGNKQELLQSVILQQYNLDNTKVYGNNYNIQNTLGIHQNQYLNRIYLTTIEGVYLQHHKAYNLDEVIVEVPEDILLMDLGDQNGQLSMVRLYDEKKLFQFDQKCDLKLNAYYISYSDGLVTFFFIQRNMLKQSGLYNQSCNQSGVEFMCVHKISKLQQLAQKFKDGNPNGSILEKNNPVFIFGATVKKLIYTNYDHDSIMKYQDNAKAASMMASTLVHEMVYDPKNPVDKIIPFLFSSERTRKPTPEFQWFFCFLDQTKLDNHIMKSFVQKNQTQVLTFDKFCDLFLMRNVEDPILSISEDDDQVIYENNRTRDCPLFCRSSPWKIKTVATGGQGVDFEDVLLSDMESEIDQYCANFQIGFAMNPQDTQMFEMSTFYVVYNKQQIFRNTDLIDIFQKKLNDTLSNIKIEPFRLQHIMPSASANEQFIGQMKYWENHRLVPRINNKGFITGTYLMLNLYMIYQENVLITDDFQKIIDQKKNIAECDFDIIMENAGQEVLLLRLKTATRGLIYLNSGRQYEVPLSILLDEFDKPLDKKLKPKPVFCYQMISTADNSKPEADPFLQYKTPIMQVGYKQYALDGQSGNLVYIVTSRFNYDICTDQIFDRVTMQHYLHQQQTQAITSSVPSFKEIFKSKFLEKAKCYFQFRYIFNGRSFCSLDYPSFKNSIQELVFAFEKVELDHTKICEDSPVYHMLDYSTDEAEENSRQVIQELYNLLQIEPFNFFLANWNQESFIQKSLDNNLNRPLLYLIDFLLNNKDEAFYKTVLVHDLPQLLSQDQVNVFQFFTEFRPSEQDLDQPEGETKTDGCRLETTLLNPDLPIMGSDELESCLVENFKCFFNMRHEIEKHILKENNIQEQNRYDELQALIQQNLDIPSETRVNIEHSFINFIPMINKIKIDLLMGRQASSLSYTKYLARIKAKPQEFDYIDDLFLADLFSQNESNLDFFNQETIQKIINRQFLYTSQFVARLLTIYTFGFVLPQIINIYQNGQELEQFMPTWKIVVQMILQTICGGTQLFFLTLEYAEIKYTGASVYFQDGWNYMDSTQYIFYTIQIYLKCHQLHSKEHSGEKFFLEMVTIICLTQSAAKFLQLIRYDESFCYLVEMLIQVSKDIYPFLIVFFTFCAVFVLVTYILEGGYDDDSYKHMGPFPMIINILQTFRNSIGDLAEPEYGRWIPKNSSNEDGYLESGYQYAIMAVTWTFFIANIFIMQIVLLNFLIAEVSMTYERVKSMGPCLLFQKKQELNFFIQKILKVYDKKNPFRALIFQVPKSFGNEDDDFGDLKDYIKNQLSYEMGKMRDQVIPNQKKILESTTNSQNMIVELQKKFEKFQDMIQNQVMKPPASAESDQMIAARNQNGLREQRVSATQSERIGQQIQRNGR